MSSDAVTGYPAAMSTPRRLLALLLTAAAFAATACGGGDAGSSGTATTGTNEAPLEDGTSVDPADGTDAPEGSPYGDTSENDAESNR